MNAAAIGFSGVLLGRRDLIEHSEKLVLMGIDRQNADGSNPEKSGTDTSYHALGLAFVGQYYSIVANAGMRTKIGTMGARGVSWLASKILENGDVDSKANTRTGPAWHRK